MKGTIILSSGGTGGHVFPALSLAEELITRGYHVNIMTDHRGQVFQKAIGNEKVISLPMWQGRGWGRLAIVVQGFSLIYSFIWALIQMIRVRPLVVVGFGGYPSIPAVLAGIFLRIPSILHEQNAILGRTNRILARFVNYIAISYDKVSHTESFQEKIVQTGNPVRKSIVMIRDVPYQSADKNEAFRLLIIGGSQGARIFSTIVPAVLCSLPEELRKRIHVFQQCRPEFLEPTLMAYQESGIVVDVRPFFDDMDDQLAKAHLVIGRAGASTIAELAVSGRPAILVPFPFAMDNHQKENAQNLETHGAAWVILEKDFTSETLKNLLKKAMEDHQVLNKMAGNMYHLGQPDAAIKLAKMVESLLPNK